MPTPGERLRLLAGLLAAPGQEGVAILEEAAGEHPWLAPACAELRRLEPEEWAFEHGRLFINGFPKTACPPFESAQLHGQMFGPAVGQLSSLYARAGLEADEDLPPYYLGTMLEFAAHLAQDGADGEDGLARELWRGHLLRWLPGYAEALLGESRLLLYRLLARELAGVCAQMSMEWGDE